MSETVKMLRQDIAELWMKERPVLQQRKGLSSRASLDNGEWTVAGWILAKLGVPLDQLTASGFVKDKENACRCKLMREKLGIPTAHVYLLCWCENHEDIARALLNPETFLGPQTDKLVKFARFLDGLTLQDWENLHTKTWNSYFTYKEWQESDLYKLSKDNRNMNAGIVHSAFQSAGHFQYADLAYPKIIYRDMPVFDAVGLAAVELLYSDEFKANGYKNFFLTFFPSFTQEQTSTE